MKKIRGWYWIMIGAILLIAAVLLVGYNIQQDYHGAEATRTILPALQEKMTATVSEEDTQELPLEQDLLAEYTEELSSEEILLEVDGETYLGTISIPSLGIELPVLSAWSYPNLKLAPCRYAGTVADGNLILAAHNYRSHFGKIGNLNSGDTIYFTDGGGVLHTYEVVQTELISGHDVPAMESNAEDWDLTLFTCTMSGRNRVTVRAMELS